MHTDEPPSRNDVTRDDIQKLHEELVRLDKKLSSRFVAPELQDLGLLDGLTQPEKYEKIAGRLTAGADEKGNLAKYLIELVRGDLESQKDQPCKLFIESGSTLAFFSAALAKKMRDEKRLAILTNNFLTLTAFGVGNTAVTRGTLERDYLAFLPFRNAHRKARVAADPTITSSPPITEQDRIWDANAYQDLETTIASTDTIYLTASGFGFLLGPHVGSRANAIFKYCLFNNRARRRLRLCLTYSKAHCEGGWADRTDVEHHVYNLCYTVFNRGSRLGLSSHLEQLSDAGVMKGEASDSLPEDDEAPGMLRSAPTELGLPMVTRGGEVCEGYGLAGLAGTWRALLEDYRPDSLEIIIGINSLDPLGQKQKLRSAYQQANKVLSKSRAETNWEPLNRKYREKQGTEDNLRALHLEVTEAGP